MDTVLRVYLEIQTAAIVFLNHFIDTGRAVELRRLVVSGQIFLKRDPRIRQLEVNRLVFLMVGV